MKKIYDVIVVGSGAAGFAAAERLHGFGIKNICIVTENVNAGTSRNAGSDKQTYYKLDICGDSGDSVMKMAADLYAGGSMMGSDALTEAANSTRCFMHLAELGVAFPTDRFGRYVGYRTDHDNTMRATSAGPLTSKFMTEKLQERVKLNGTEILDGHQVIKLIVDGEKCTGVVCLTDNGIEKIYSKAVILCTGASAAMYSRSVYPESQRGATGLAVEAGAELSNYQEWQYGIASVKFRWNLSGSYQQVIPTYYSLSPDGKKTEFLNGENRDEMYSLVFLKGYQWPFDSRKTEGSSMIDMLVFAELEKGNRVFLDYTKNPEGFCFDRLSEEAREYLINTDSLGETPFERLMKLNPKAVKLYRDHGIDLASEPLEISISAQHNNGGIRTDMNSESSVENLFAAGEAAGKFGVYRPGGSALNDTQVSALCAAKYLASKLGEITVPDEKECEIPMPRISDNPTLSKAEKEFSLKMSDCCGIIRDYGKIRELIGELREVNGDFYNMITVPDMSYAGEFFGFRLTVMSMLAMCETCLSSIENIGSRGGCICIRDGKRIGENEEYRKYVTVTKNGRVSYVHVDEIPNEKAVFEKLLKSE